MNRRNDQDRCVRGPTALRCLVAWLAAWLSLSAWAASADLLTPAERAWLGAHPRIVLGAGEDWAPMIVKDAKGNVTGFAIDHLALLNEKLGTDIRIEAGPWHEIVARAEAGAIDGLTLTSPIEERRDRFVFTEPYFTGHNFIFLRAGDGRWKDGRVRMNDLRGHRVGYLKGTLRISQALANVPGATAVAADSYEALANALLAGEIDAAIASYSLEYWRASRGMLGIVPALIVPETETRIVMSIRKDRAPLAGILDKGLAAIRQDEVEPLYRRWFGDEYVRKTGMLGARFTPEEHKWIAQHPMLRVGIDPGWAPVEFVDGAGVPRGMTIAYLERLSAATGLRFEVVPGLSWSDALRRLREREIDVLPAVAAAPDRAGAIAFTEPYLTFPAAIFSAADVAYLGGLESLRGKRVAVARGEAVTAWLAQAWPDVVLVPVEDTAEGLRRVASGDAFAFVGNLVTTSYYIGQSGLTQIKVAGETPFVYRLGMGVRNDWPILAGILQKGIDAMPASERDAIYREWLAVRYEHRVDYSLLWKVLAGALLVLLLVIAERVWRVKAANARLSQLARELSLVEERERRRLAGELHDSPMQKLALAQMQFGAAPGDGASGQRIANGLDLMREAIDELRTLQFELSPPMLEKEGLVPTLRWLASHASERSDVQFAFHGPAGALALPEEIAIVLYQCARELVYNVVKHAGARNATIKLSAGDGDVTLTVGDDGRGFGTRPTAWSRSGGFGLFSIRERVGLFGGDVVVRSDGSGAQIRVRMPVPTRPVPAAVPERDRPPASAAQGAL